MSGCECKVSPRGEGIDSWLALDDGITPEEDVGGVE